MSHYSRDDHASMVMPTCACDEFVGGDDLHFGDVHASVDLPCAQSAVISHK
jgi:hypothetical protein